MPDYCTILFCAIFQHSLVIFRDSFFEFSCHQVRNFISSSDWYNFAVPTPFYHLNIAEELLEHLGLRPALTDLINTYRFTFLLGNVAPDVQVISGQTRESTHFYILPTKADDLPPWERMLNTFSSIAFVDEFDLEQIVFIAGYLCHLQADWLWTQQIYEPYFGPNSHWKTFQERLYLHNVLRSYLDYQVFESIKRETGSGLTQANARTWLPFIDIKNLEGWRDYLAEQLKPGAPIQTVEIFASRQGISAEKYHRLLNTEDEMQRQIFDYLPCRLLKVYRRGLLTENVKMLNEYLAEVGGKFNANY